MMIDEDYSAMIVLLGRFQMYESSDTKAKLVRVLGAIQDFETRMGTENYQKCFRRSVALNRNFSPAELIRGSSLCRLFHSGIRRRSRKRNGVPETVC